MEESEGRRRPSTGRDPWQRLRRAFHEFLAVPTGIVLGFLVLALLTYVLDSLDHPLIDGARSFMRRHIFADPQSTSSFLSTIGSSVITVASITFSVLFLAVQQSASTLSAQVYDQYMRRRANQTFFGFFLGLGLYTLVTLAMVNPAHNAILGGTVALVLTAVALLLIPAVIYSTLNQMRPVEIVAAIHGHAIESRDHQEEFLRRTRRSARRSGHGLVVEAANNGFVTDVSLEGLHAAIEDDGDAEIELECRVGDFIVPGDRLAVVRAASGPIDNRRIEQQIRGAVTLDRQRNIDVDPAYGLAELEAIGWTSVSSSKQNPSPGIMVVHHLRDLMATWTAAGDRPGNDDRGSGDGGHDGDARDDQPDVLPIVYRDNVMELLVTTLSSLLVGASEGMQHQTAAVAYSALATMLPRLPTELRAAAAGTVVRTLTALGDHVLTLELERALGAVAASFAAVGDLVTSSAVTEAVDELARGVGQLSARGSRPASVG